MNRRGFLNTLLTATVAMAFDPECLLWVPGKKTIFIPKIETPSRWIIGGDWAREGSSDHSVVTYVFRRSSGDYVFIPS